MARRELLASSLVAAPFLLGFSRVSGTAPFTPEQFGAKGDGVTNDTLAFARLSAAVERAGGGVIRLSRTTYRVGLQRAIGAGDYVLSPTPILALSDLTDGVRIEGNGAVLRCAPGLSFGSFEAGGVRPRQGVMPHVDLATRATPYEAMILIQRSRGPVRITGVELDGQIQRAVIGGGWGDVGRQIQMSGIVLRDNRGPELVADVFSHDHGLDGMMIDGRVSPSGVDRRIERVRCLRNARQGCSLIGGHGYRFWECDFSDTGRGVLASSPGAGVDIEAEGGKTIADVQFSACRFAGNVGCGAVADSGPSRDVRFTDCTMVGTTAWSNWSAKPGFVYDGCTFVGAVAHPFGSAAAAEATRFSDCLFTDDPGRGQVATAYLADPFGSPILDAGGAFDGGRNVLFDRCSFDCVEKGLLPWTVNTIFQDCRMHQTSSRPSYPRGIYRGSSQITGAAMLDGSRIEGTVLLNGRSV